VKPKLLCYDHYALFEGVERDGYFANMETIRRSALKYDAAMGFILQCTPHGTYRDPSETDLRWQVNTALAYGCRAILYFTYFTPTDPAANFHNGILDPSGKRTVHYDMAKKINGELKALIPTLVQLKSTGVFHTGPVPSGCVALPADAPVQVRAGGPVMIGMFQHNDGSQWAIIVNRDLRKASPLVLSFADSARAVEGLTSRSPELVPIPLSGRDASFDLPPGGMKLLRMGS